MARLALRPLHRQAPLQRCGHLGEGSCCVGGCQSGCSGILRALRLARGGALLLHRLRLGPELAPLAVVLLQPVWSRFWGSWPDGLRGRGGGRAAAAGRILAALRSWADGRSRLGGRPLVVYGRSIGGVCAVHLAARSGRGNGEVRLPDPGLAAR